MVLTERICELYTGNGGRASKWHIAPITGDSFLRGLGQGTRYSTAVSRLPRPFKGRLSYTDEELRDSMRISFMRIS